MSERAKPIDDVTEIPANLSDEEMIDFLDERGVSEEFLENTPEAPEEERPVPRTKPTNIRFDDHTLGRLKDLAGRRNVGYQTLLKQFVTERLYEEERREGILPTDPAAETGQPITPPKSSVGRMEGKPRDWQKEAFAFAKDNEELLEDPDIDPISLSRLARNSSSRLLELSGEIKKASAKQGYPATQLRRMMKGYGKLKEFTERALELYEERFGSEDSEEGESDDPDAAAIRDVLEAAERILQET